MNHTKPLLGLVLTGFLVSGCSSYETKEANLENYKSTLLAAQMSLDKAKKANYEWRDSRKFLQQAEKAAKAGDFSKAIELAAFAGRQGDLAVKQSIEQKDAGPM